MTSTQSGKWKYVYSSSSSAPGFGVSGHEGAKYFKTRKDLLKFAYASPIGYISTSKYGKVYNTETKKMVAYIDNNRYYTMNSKGDIYVQSFDYKEISEKKLYEKGNSQKGYISYCRKQFLMG